MQFTFKDNSVEVMKKLSHAIDGVAQTVEADLVEAVQDKILYGYQEPHGADGHTEIVDTGRLFDSIKAEVKRVSQNTVDVTVGSTGSTPYAVYVHNGTRKLKGRPFITDAINESRPDIRATMIDGLQNA